MAILVLVIQLILPSLGLEFWKLTWYGAQAKNYIALTMFLLLCAYIYFDARRGAREDEYPPEAAPESGRPESIS